MCQNFNLELVTFNYFSKICQNFLKAEKDIKQCIVVKNYEAWYTDKIDILYIEPPRMLIKQKLRPKQTVINLYNITKYPTISLSD